MMIFACDLVKPAVIFYCCFLIFMGYSDDTQLMFWNL